MTDCGCAKAKAELEEFIHHELESKDAAEVAEHIEGCVDCTNEHEVGITLTVAVKRACIEIAPERLRAEVVARLREVAASR